MSVSRVLIGQGERLYRLFKLETSPDGSVYVMVDRDPRSNKGGMTMDANGVFVPSPKVSDKPLPAARYSLHTTGKINQYIDGDRKASFNIEPLYSLIQLRGFGFVSIPRASKLDVFDEDIHTSDAVAILTVPEEVSERITFALEIGPKPQEPSTFGVGLNYELYSIVIRMAPLALTLPDLMSEHFIYGTPVEGLFDEPQASRAQAELAFHKAIYGDQPPVFREKDGSYLVLTAVPMRVSPKLRVAFDRDDLRIELIPFGVQFEPTHKVKFWICDKGGRNRRDDLRGNITSIEMDARL